MGHDFTRFPELTNSQMDFYYWESPHKQILEDFAAKVNEVVDGDTIWVTCDFRDFRFKIRLANINAPELNEGGKESKKWLESKVTGKNIFVVINPTNRVGKFGRIIGEVFCEGENISEALLRENLAKPFGERDEIEDDYFERWGAREWL